MTSPEHNAVLALVPARGGSRGIPRKNLVLVGGHPLVAWAIVAGQAAGFARVVVSSEDEEILAVAVHYGAEPLERPRELADERAEDQGVIAHARLALDWPDGALVAYLRPTTPLRDPAVLQAAVRVLMEDARATALRSVHLAPESPLKWYAARADGRLAPVNRSFVNRPRQSCPEVWVPNGAIDVLRHAAWGDRVVGFAAPGLEVDSPAQLAYIRWVATHERSPLAEVLANGRAHGVTR